MAVGSAAQADASVQALLARVGARVHQLRQERGLSRKRLSDQSGVSPRYLAQIESGHGNMSLALLQRVALAFELPLEALISTPNARDQRISLVGLRGAGKSTLGRRAAERLGLPFLELNREIERGSGMPVSEILALYGDDGYRRLEAEALERVANDKSRMVLAVGGGIVGNAQSYDRLLNQFHTIWLKARPEEHMTRVRAQGDERPMAGDPERAMGQLRRILTAREAEYARASATLDTSGKTVETSLRGLVRVIETQGFLKVDRGC